MVTIDLTSPAPPARGLLDGLPRRLSLTLPELRTAARLAGGAPLPFEAVEPAGGTAGREALAGRLGDAGGPDDAHAWADAVASLHDPEDTLCRRGLVVGDSVDPCLAGALGLLATPRLALEIDVAVAGVHARSWHRQGDGAVATLSTCDGVVFEIAWFAAEKWAGELARVTGVPDGTGLSPSALPDPLDLPLALVDAAGEALRAGRADLVPVLLSQHGEGAVTSGGEPLGDAEAAAAVSALHTEGRGRLRVLGAEVTPGGATDVGVVSWVLLADGWHSLTPRLDDGASRVAVRRVDPDDLAAELAPVLAQVVA